MSVLKPVISVDEEKCVNCHNCIAVCPVKFCIDGSGEKVSIRHELCIGCGSCIKGCTHHARSGKDDTAEFFAALSRKEPMVAIVAPAIATRLGDSFLRLNGWLKQNGIKAVFDVAYGAELTVKSYMQHIHTNKPRLVIAQPCPAIVNYIQIYQSSLAKYLAPADSPMLHTIKMLQNFRPDLKNCKIAVISPCVAKKREFDETGLGDFNVTIETFLKALSDRGIQLEKFPEEDFDNPPAETAVLFSSPGGLKQTVERDFPELSTGIRRIEGPKAVYPYFKELEESLKAGVNPLVIDCLNCEKGCNGGTGTGSEDIPIDLLESRINARKAVQQRRLSGVKINHKKAAKKVSLSLEKFWKPGLYSRAYEDRSTALAIRTPGEADFKRIYSNMAKIKETDFLNCAACGYNSCEMMAVAIFNGLNKSENCHHYQAVRIQRGNDQLRATAIQLNEKLVETTTMIGKLLGLIPELDRKSELESTGLVESTLTIKEMIQALKKTAELSGTGKRELNLLDVGVKESGETLEQSLSAIKVTAAKMDGIHEMVSEIDKIAAQTNLLSMNAAIEAAHAGDSGKGFAVVAEEIRRLSEQASESAKKIGKTLGELITGMNNASTLSDNAGRSVRDILAKVGETASNLEEMYHALNEISANSEKVNTALASLGSSAQDVKTMYKGMNEIITRVGEEVQQISVISQSRVSAQ